MAERRLRFTAIVGVKDEADILPRTIEQLRAIGVTTIVVRDFGSTDGTLEYLADAETAGDIWVVHRDDVPPGGVGKRATIALARASDADFVLFIDADELVLPRTGSLHDLGDTASADVLSVMRYNVVATEQGPALPQRDQAGHVRPAAPLGAADPGLLSPRPPRARHPVDPRRARAEGHAPAALPRRPPRRATHDADLSPDRPWRRVLATDVVIAHVPIRARERFAIRAANYGAAIARRPECYSGFQGWQWVRFAQAAERGPRRRRVPPPAPRSRRAGPAAGLARRPLGARRPRVAAPRGRVRGAPSVDGRARGAVALGGRSRLSRRGHRARAARSSFSMVERGRRPCSSRRARS